MTIDLSAAPYYDDFNSSDNYYKILFNPARPVQARELTQIQSILQQQIKSGGDFTFQNGTMVIPGHLFYDNSPNFLVLNTTYNQTNIETYLAGMVGTTITGAINGITAIVISYDVATDTDPTTIYIKYTSAAGVINAFLSGETFSVASNAGLVGSIQSVTSYTGKCALCSIGSGVFYVNGYFVGVANQIVTLSKYNNTPSSIVGLDYIESIVTAAQDSALYDNAAGFSNYGAPGADRLQVSLTLNVKAYNYAVDNTSTINFIELLQVSNGVVQLLSNDTQYAYIESLVARRTFEQSGNFVTSKFSFNAFNYRNNDVGQWQANFPYIIGDVISNNSINYIALNQGYSGSTAPSQSYGVQSDGALYWNELPNKTQFVNNGKKLITSTALLDQVNADNTMAVITSPGTAFVNGYEDIFAGETYSLVPKARSITQISQAQIYAPAGSYVLINTVRGQPNITTNLTQVNLLDSAGNVLGNAWVRSLEYVAGLMSSPDTVQYALFLFDVNMNYGIDFNKQVHSVLAAGAFSGNIVLTPTSINGSVSVLTAGTTVTGAGTYFEFDLSVGTQVQVNNVWTSVASIISPTQFITTTSLSTSTNTTCFVGTGSVNKIGDYISPLIHPAVSTMRNSTGAIDMEYVISQYYQFVATTTTKTFTVTNGQTFQPSGHILCLNTGVVSTSVPINASYSLSTDGTALTISGLTATDQYNLLAITKRTGAFAKEKTKFISTNTITLTSATTQTFSSRTIMLPNADCNRLIKVTESGTPSNLTAYTSANEVDITQYFIFNTGQTSDFYGLGYLNTTRNNAAPIRITYEYFTHSSGDYFSVDSYAAIPESLIGTVTLGNNTYYLPDCLDFRSRIADNGLNFDTANNASISDPLLSTTTLSSSYSYFTPRLDSIGIGIDNLMGYNIGSDFTTGMKLATINVAPYTFYPPTDVTFSDDQVMTYTMKDIGNIDTRVSNVEYYVALSQSEQSAVNATIVDQYGIPVTKNGFLVDGFTNYDIADMVNPDCKTYIATDANFSQCSIALDGASLIEPIGTTTASRIANGYQLTGNSVTLPYTEVPMIAQILASTPAAIQAFASLNYTGQLTLYPNIDSYVDNLYNTITTTSIAAPITNTINQTTLAPTTAILSQTVTTTPDQGGSSSIICTKLYEAGLLDYDTYLEDELYGKLIRERDSDIYNGYIMWAKYVVFAMNHSTIFTKFIRHIAEPWYNEMKYEVNKANKSSYIGKIMMLIGLPICKMLGRIQRSFKC